MHRLLIQLLKGFLRCWQRGITRLFLPLAHCFQLRHDKVFECELFCPFGVNCTLELNHLLLFLFFGLCSIIRTILHPPDDFIVGVGIQLSIVPRIRHSATILCLCIQSSLRSGVNGIFFNLALCVVLLGRAFLDIQEGE